MLELAARNLARRPLRTGLTVSGVAAAMAVLACLLSFGQGYRRGLDAELERTGLQMMLVPLGCPYDAAARVLKGRKLENSVPEAAVEQVRRDPAVAAAAPLLLAAMATPEKGRADMWAGVDESALALKPWWHVTAGSNWFTGPNSVILGCDAAEIEMRRPGDEFFSPETGRKLRVAGVLARSGTSDDSLFFVPLQTAQEMFDQRGRLTAIAVRLRDPVLLRQAVARLQQVKGAQVVSLTEMMGTFLNLLGAVRTLIWSIAVVALTVSGLSVFNTLLASVLERTRELAILRAVGGSRAQVLKLVTAEAFLLTSFGSTAGLALTLAGGRSLERLVRAFVPLAPSGHFLSLEPAVLAGCLTAGLLLGTMAGLYPAFRASRVAPAEALSIQ